MIKSQSWERQKEKSEKIKEKLKVFIQFCHILLQVSRSQCFQLVLQSRLNQRSFRSSSGGDQVADTVSCLQEHLRREIEEHVGGRGTGACLTNAGDFSEDVSVSQIDRR